jgi:Flp pilus assembly pilin Flp
MQSLPAQLHTALKKHLSRLLRDIRAQGIVEYVLLLALIAFAAVAAEQAFACQLQCAFENAANQLEHILAKGKKIPPGQAKKCSKKCD